MKQLRTPPTSSDRHDASDGQRAQVALDFVRRWILAPVLDELAGLYGVELAGRYDFAARFSQLLHLSEREWNTRAGQERWLASAIQLPEATMPRMKRALDGIGLLECREPGSPTYSHTAVLGGGLTAPLHRMNYLKRLLEAGTDLGRLFLLGSNRAVGAEELEHVRTYANGALSEFDLMIAAYRAVFAGSGAPMSVRTVGRRRSSTRSPEFSDFVVGWLGSAEGPEAIALAAPHAKDRMRANTADTLQFFSKVEDLDATSNVLIVTTSLFAPFQHAEAVRTIYVPFGASVETVGPSARDEPDRRSATSLLLEVRSAVLAMHRLWVECEHVLHNGARARGRPVNG